MDGNITSVMYYINDGVYGSFNAKLYEDAVFHGFPLEVSSAFELLLITIDFSHNLVSNFMQLGFSNQRPRWFPHQSGGLHVMVLTK